MIAPRPRAWLATIGLATVMIAASGCATAGGNAPAPSSGSSLPASQAPVPSTGGGAGDTSSSKVTKVCSAIKTTDADAAFGGTWSVMADYDNGAPLVCGISNGPLALSVELKPGGAASQAWYGDSVPGIGQKADFIANILSIQRGADIIQILWLSKMTDSTKANMIKFGTAIYPGF